MSKVRVVSIIIFTLLLISCGGHFGGDGEMYLKALPQAPTVSTLSDLTNPTVYFTANSADTDVVSFECKIDDGEWEADCSTGRVYSELNPGEYTVYVRAVNQYGNKGPATAKSIRRGEMAKGFDGTVYTSTFLSDGSLVLGGNFSRWRPESAPAISRLSLSGNFNAACLSSSGFNGDVQAIIRIGDDYIIGGQFTSYKGTTCNRIVKLNKYCEIDTTFQTNVGSAFDNSVYALATDGTSIYVGGSFTSFNGVGAVPDRIIKLAADGTYNATGFNTNIGTGLSSTVYAIALSDDGSMVYAGGAFTQFNGGNINGSAGARVIELESDGTFNNGAGTFNNNIGQGFNTTVYALYFYGDALYVGGTFTTFDGVAGAPDALIKLIADGTASDGTDDGTFTTNLGTGIGPGGSPGDIRDITVSGGYVYAVGSGNFLDGTEIPTGAYKFDTDGNFYNIFDSGTGIGFQQGGLFALLHSVSVYGNKLYIAGRFNKYNGTTAAQNIIKLDLAGNIDSTFQTNVGLGFDSVSTVNVVLADSNGLILGGDTEFFAGTSLAYGIAKFKNDLTLDASFNTIAGTGVGSAGTAYTLAVDSSDNIYVGGNFTAFNSSGSIPGYIVKLSSSGSVNATFSTNATDVADGFNSSARTIIVDGSSLYIGGAFTSFDGSATNRIVKLNLDGTTDTTFPVGADDVVYALAISGTSLFAGGAFTDRIAAFNATTGAFDGVFDSNLGTGFNGDVNSLQVSGTSLYIGGAFTTFNGGAANRLKKLNLDGTEDGGFDASIGTSAVVHSIYESNGYLYVGGDFTDRIAKYDSSTGALNASFDTAVGTGFDAIVYDVNISGNYLYSSGAFTAFDGSWRYSTARFNLLGDLDEYFEGQGR